MEPKIATLALIVQNDHLLLGHKIKKGADIGEQTLNGPGGKLEPGQSLFECLYDETLTETGLVLHESDVEEVAVVTFHNGTRNVFIGHVYLVHSFEGTPTNSAEMVEPHDGWWHNLSNLPFERMLASDRYWMPRVLAGERLRADVYQTDDGHELTKPVEFHPY